MKKTNPSDDEITVAELSPRLSTMFLFVNLPNVSKSLGDDNVNSVRVKTIYSVSAIDKRVVMHLLSPVLDASHRIHILRTYLLLRELKVIDHTLRDPFPLVGDRISTPNHRRGASI